MYTTDNYHRPILKLPPGETPDWVKEDRMPANIKYPEAKVPKNKEDRMPANIKYPEEQVPKNIEKVRTIPSWWPWKQNK